MCEREEVWEMSKSMGSWLGGCVGIQETKAPYLASALVTQCHLRASHFTCSATSLAPSLLLNPLVCLDHEFFRTGTTSFYIFARCLVRIDLHSGDLRYHSHVNNYSGSKSHPGSLPCAKSLLFWAQGVSELESPATKLTMRGCWVLDPLWHSILQRKTRSPAIAHFHSCILKQVHFK